MTHHLIRAGVVAATLVLASSLKAEAPSGLPKGVDARGFRYFRALLEADREANVAFSPVGLSTVLALAANGADGETRNEIEAVAGAREGIETVNEPLSDLLIQWAEGSEGLSSTTTVKGPIEFRVTESFQEILQDYSATLLLGPIESPETAWNLTITNTLHFSGSWEHFDTKDTRGRPFFPAPGEQLVVQTMVAEDTYDFVDDPLCQAIRLPYVNDRFSLLVLLPADPKQRVRFENGLNPDQLRLLIDSLEMTELKVFLPRFGFEKTTDLTGVSKSLGMQRAFENGRAEFSPMAQTPLFLSSFEQEVVLDLDERGTAAQTTTTALFDPFGAGPALPPPPPPVTPVFRANHPFLFFVLDEKTGTIVVMGRIANPADDGQPEDPFAQAQ